MAAALIAAGSAGFAVLYWPFPEPIISGTAFTVVLVLFLFAAWDLLLDWLGAPPPELTDRQWRRRTLLRTAGAPLGLLGGLLFGHLYWA